MGQDNKLDNTRSNNLFKTIGLLFQSWYLTEIDFTASQIKCYTTLALGLGLQLQPRVVPVVQPQDDGHGHGGGRDLTDLCHHADQWEESISNIDQSEAIWRYLSTSEAGVRSYTKWSGLTIEIS